MNADELVHDFYKAIAESRGETLRYIVGLKSNVEGWFKVEFAYYLHRRGLREFRERRVNGGKRVDVGFVTTEKLVRHGDKTVYFELKHIIPRKDVAIGSIRPWFDRYIAHDLIKLHDIHDDESETSPVLDEKYQLTFVSAETEDENIEERVRPELSAFQKGHEKGIQYELVNCEFNPKYMFGYFLIRVFS